MQIQKVQACNNQGNDNSLQAFHNKLSVTTVTLQAMPSTRSRYSPSSTHYRVSSSAPSCYSSGPPSSSPQYLPQSASQGDMFHCPFMGYDGFHNGVNGRGYAKSTIYRHITDKHFPTDKDKDTCKERIQNNFDYFVSWEMVLLDMQMWLCFKCLHIHAWKKPCKSDSHPADIIAGSLNGNDAYFLIHGVSRPQAIAATTTEATPDTNKPAKDDATVCLGGDI
ncbi:hypothetical protein C5167_020504 [Papaver somniferum]|uniref:Uncharacterized protein n=1 Tax=Papaver somniferum TaxID=3469 RepID=A0A4Y7IT75_PAPSO|nr:hypothetical protein C5167_020504 [Papaver somniferum]